MPSIWKVLYLGNFSHNAADTCTLESTCRNALQRIQYSMYNVYNWRGRKLQRRSHLQCAYGYSHSSKSFLSQSIQSIASVLFVLEDVSPHIREGFISSWQTVAPASALSCWCSGGTEEEKRSRRRTSCVSSQRRVKRKDLLSDFVSRVVSNKYIIEDRIK